RLTSCFAKAVELLRLGVSLKKTEVLYQPPPQDNHFHPPITIGESELESVQLFSYLYSITSSDIKIDKEIDSRLTNVGKTVIIVS
uniref:Uncharacterized protein n=1 Tax=Loa loa TaxID=7209 RepID=A0A1I7VU79_LOALO